MLSVMVSMVSCGILRCRLWRLTVSFGVCFGVCYGVCYVVEWCLLRCYIVAAVVAYVVLWCLMVPVMVHRTDTARLITISKLFQFGISHTHLLQSISCHEGQIDLTPQTPTFVYIYTYTVVYPMQFGFKHPHWLDYLGYLVALCFHHR